MTNNTKHIQLQISGDADAVNAAIAILHTLNFINGSVWSNAIRKWGQDAIVRVASREINLPPIPTHPSSDNQSLN